MDFLEECPARRIRLRNQTRNPKRINMVSGLGRRNKVKMACHDYAELGYFGRNACKQGRYSMFFLCYVCNQSFIAVIDSPCMWIVYSGYSD